MPLCPPRTALNGFVRSIRPRTPIGEQMPPPTNARLALTGGLPLRVHHTPGVTQAIIPARTTEATLAMVIVV